MAEKEITFMAENGREFTTDEVGFIRGEVLVDLPDLIDRDLEGALDMFSQRLTGGDLLMDITYKAVRVEGESLVVEVSGDPAMILEMQKDRGHGPSA